ncbi:retrovirus-related pol polyprotein from transposon TNT 1-94 [Tanacetum coccineum]
MVCMRPGIAYAVSVVSRYLVNLDRGNHADVTGFVDSDYAKDTNKGRGEVYGLYGGCEGSYLAKGTLKRVGVELNTVADNCEIHLSHNHVFHKRTKHINVHYHFIKDVMEAKMVKVLKVGIEHKVADALTKVVPGLKLQHCLELLSVGIG